MTISQELFLGVVKTGEQVVHVRDQSGAIAENDNIHDIHSY